MAVSEQFGLKKWGADQMGDAPEKKAKEQELAAVVRPSQAAWKQRLHGAFGPCHQREDERHPEGKHEAVPAPDWRVPSVQQRKSRERPSHHQDLAG